MTELIQITSGSDPEVNLQMQKGGGGILGHALPENFENPVSQIG